jgi:hypothetical protein
MTIVYGVTFIGANRMIIKQLEDQKLVPTDKVFQSALYLTRLVSGSFCLRKYLAE